MTSTKTNHAIDNATAWHAEIVVWLEKQHESYEEAEEIKPEPLSVQVRSDWCDPGSDMKAGEYMILLSTGGPALRIIGDLDQSEPYDAKLQWQDWGTPWTDVHCDTKPVLAYAQSFYFGE